MRNSGTKEHFVNTTNNAEKIFTKIENSVFVTMTVKINRLWIQFIIIETTLMLLFISMKKRIFFSVDYLAFFVIVATTFHRQFV